MVLKFFGILILILSCFSKVEASTLELVWTELFHGDLGVRVLGDLSAIKNCPLMVQYSSTGRLLDKQVQVFPMLEEFWLPIPAKAGRLSIFSHQSCTQFPQAATKLRLEQIKTALPDLQTSFAQGIRMYPSWLDRPEGIYILVLLFLVLMVWIIWGYQEFLSRQILLVFIVLFVIRQIYILFSDINPLSVLENASRNQVRENLSLAWLDVSNSMQTAEQFFLKDMHDFKTRVSQWFFSNNPDETMMRQNLSHVLKEAVPSSQFRVMMAKEPLRHDVPWAFTSDKEYSDVYIRRSYLDDMYPICDALFGREGTTISQDEYQKSVNKVSAVREMLQKSLDPSFKLDYIFSNPERYFDMFTVGLDFERIFGSGTDVRYFWSMIPLGEWRFLLIGEVLEPYLVDKLIQAQGLHEKHLQEISGLEGLDIYLNGYGERNMGIHGTQHFRPLRYMARRESGSPTETFFTYIQDGKFWFAWQDYNPGVRNHVTTLILPGEPVLLALQRTKNWIFLGILGFVAGLVLVTAWFGRRISRPMQKLKTGLSRVAANQLDSEILVVGQDQFAMLAKKFNEMIVSLREKEFMQRFLSRMARQALNSDQGDTIREQVMILYCGFKNMEEQLENGEIHHSLSAIQKIVVHHGGMVDKFTGSAVLCLFRTPHDYHQAFLAALEISRYANSKRQFSVGLAYGEVILGHIGSSLRKDFTCIGNTVNMAARLGSRGLKNNHCILHADDEAIQRLKDPAFYGIQIRQHTGIPIKGKKETQTLNEFFST